MIAVAGHKLALRWHLAGAENMSGLGSSPELVGSGRHGIEVQATRVGNTGGSAGVAALADARPADEN